MGDLSVFSENVHLALLRGDPRCQKILRERVGVCVCLYVFVCVSVCVCVCACVRARVFAYCFVGSFACLFVGVQSCLGLSYRPYRPTVRARAGLG